MTDANAPQVLLLDDDESLTHALVRVLRPIHAALTSATSAEAGRACLAAKQVGVVLCEPRQPALAAVLADARERYPATVRVILTGYPAMSSVVKAVNEAQPFRLLTKPWDNDELVATVTLALEQYARNRERDRLIGEYAGIRASAEHAHAYHALGALVQSVSAQMAPAAADRLPVGALLLKDGAMDLINPSAQRMLGELGLPVPSRGDAAASLPGWVGAALAAPRRERRVVQAAEGVRVDCAAVDLECGTLILFTPVPDFGHAPP